jgi:hypothetical protein
LRRRVLWVRDTRAPRPFQETAANVAKHAGLYDLSSGETADESWGYEPLLPPALGALADPGMPLDGRMWLSVLVRFVAALFVRYPEFADEFRSRFAPELLALADVSPDDATIARVVEYQQLLAPIMASQWTVIHFPSSVELITNDLGLAPTRNLQHDFGYAVPIDPRTALVVSECAERRILRWSRDRWVADINHVTMTAAQASGLVESIEGFALNAVFGPSRQSVARRSRVGGPGRPRGGLLRPAVLTDLTCHQYDYFRVLSATSVPPLKAGCAAEVVDWDAIEDSDWTGRIVVEALFPLRTIGGVTVDGFDISLSLEHGMMVQRDRHAAGDFRKGGYVIMPFDRDRLRSQKVAGLPPGPRPS